MTPDFIFNMTPGDVVYDIETFPNAFTLNACHAESKVRWRFEISFRRNDRQLLCSWMDTMQLQGCRMIGFNSVGFDYPVLHFIYTTDFISAAEIYTKAMSIIGVQDNARFAHIVWDSDRIVQQVDLFKVHHFDNMSKSTSLKVLEFNMKMDVEDLPFPVGTVLTSEQIDVLHRYNDDDVNATLEFYRISEPALKLRESLSASFGINMMNMSDVKIGETLLITEMEKHGIECHYIDSNGRKQKKQTKHDSLQLRDVIFPYIRLEHPEFNRLRLWLAAQIISETKGVFTDLTATIEGIEYKLGTGGIHASVDSSIIVSTDTHQIVDVDVASFYPNLGIKNKVYPAHLGPQFCDAYESVYETRKTFPKKTPENEAYKLALNGAFGGSNNEYSPFLDMAYAMAITLNGQLSLCMLIEQMLKVPGLKMIQANTDGITYLCPREYLDHTRSVCRWWEDVTKLELEEALYKRMFIRDVNNYIAEFENGDLKRIGCYAYVTATEKPGTRELPHHKDWSSRVVAKAAEARLVHGIDIREFIENHDDVYDFMLRTKVPRSMQLEWGGVKAPNTIRYYVSTDGDILEKVSSPKGKPGQFKRANKLTDSYYQQVMEEIGEGVWDERIHTKNKSTYEEVRTGIHTGWTVMICNRLGGRTFNDIDHDYYIKEAEKLTACML